MPALQSQPGVVLRGGDDCGSGTDTPPWHQRREIDYYLRITNTRVTVGTRDQRTGCGLASYGCFMRRTAYVWGVALLMALPVACSTGGVSDADAINQIRAAGGYPRRDTLIFFDIGRNTPLGVEASRLVSEGYITVDNRLNENYNCRPTEKGKDLIESCMWAQYTGQWMKLGFYTHTVDVTRVVDKQTDPNGQSGTVLYEVRLTPTEGLARLQNVDPQRTNAELRKKKSSETKAAYFSKWESGWKVGSIE